MASKQDLAPRESQIFKSILKHFDAKQYKKGLKCAEEILKVNPNHGETLAMKGLLLNSMGKKEEAHEFVKLGLRNNIASYTCWHVYGLIHKSDRNYAEAMKCYQNALKRDQKNSQVLRDLANLQIQTRSLHNFAITRRELLLNRPHVYELWYGFAVALQFIEEYDNSIKTMLLFEDIVAKTEKNPLEINERKLFIVYLYDLAQKYEDGLKYIEENESGILDKTQLTQTKGEMHMKLGNMKAAEAFFRQLIDINPDNFQYHQLLQKSLSLVPNNGEAYTDEQVAKLDELYEELLVKFPKCLAVQRIPLNFLNGEKFRSKLSKYVVPALIKGVPSLFASLSQLYEDVQKRDIIEQLLLSFEKSLKETSKFPDSETEEPPSILLWTLFFLSQHFDKLRDYDRAMAYINEAITHTPTAIDLYVFKGKILKHQGDANQAAELVEYARTLDLADRYLNTKTTLYLLRANKIEEAEKTVELFSKDPEVSLPEFQCMWYELESGEALLRTGKLGRALTKFCSVEKHFEDFIEDQFDFHAYCLRKLTLRAYSKFIKYEDKIYSEEKYFRAIRGAIQVYITLHDRPKVPDTPEALFAHLTGGERKKAIKKYKRDQLKLAEEKKKLEELERKKGNNTNKKQNNEEEYLKLEKTENPLKEAMKFVTSINRNFPNRETTHLLSFQVYVRRNLFLLALKSLNNLRRISPAHPEIPSLVKQLYEEIEKNPPSTPVVSQVLAEARGSF